MAFRKVSSREEDRSVQGERSHFWIRDVLCIICDNNSHISKTPATYFFECCNVFVDLGSCLYAVMGLELFT